MDNSRRATGLKEAISMVPARFTDQMTAVHLTF